MRHIGGEVRPCRRGSEKTPRRRCDVYDRRARSGGNGIVATGSPAGTCRFPRLFFLITTVISAFLCETPGQAAEVKHIRNDLTPAHVRIFDTDAYFVPAKGLVPDKSSDRFASSQRGIEIIAATVDSPYLEIRNGFTDSALASRGVEVKSRGALTINGADAVLIKALHKSDGKKWGKWILLLDEGENRTLVINGIFVGGDGDAAKDVESMLKSVVLRKNDRISADLRGGSVEN